MTCHGLRLGILTSAALLLSALGLGWLTPALWGATVTTAYLGLLSLFAALAVLASTLLLSLLPGAAQRRSECLR